MLGRWLSCTCGEQDVEKHTPKPRRACTRLKMQHPRGRYPIRPASQGATTPCACKGVNAKNETRCRQSSDETDGGYHNMHMQAQTLNTRARLLNRLPPNCPVCVCHVCCCCAGLPWASDRAHPGSSRDRYFSLVSYWTRHAEQDLAGSCRTCMHQ